MKKHYLILTLGLFFSTSIFSMSNEDHAQQQHYKYARNCGFITGFLANTAPQTTLGTTLANIVAMGTTAFWYMLSCGGLEEGFYPELKTHNKNILFQKTEPATARAYPIVPLTGYLTGSICGQISKRLVPVFWAYAQKMRK